MRPGIDYYVSTLSLDQETVAVSTVRLVFVGELPIWVRVYEAGVSGRVRLVSDLRPVRQTKTSCEYLDTAEEVPGRSARVYLMDRGSAADKALKEIESQWPEWDRPYLVHGLLLERAQPREARQKLQTAIALGSQELAARCAAARLAPPGTNDSRCSCVGGIYELMFPKCAQP